jgi:hypothetical protein
MIAGQPGLTAIRIARVSNVVRSGHFRAANEVWGLNSAQPVTRVQANAEHCSQIAEAYERQVAATLAPQQDEEDEALLVALAHFRSLGKPSVYMANIAEHAQKQLAKKGSLVQMSPPPCGRGRPETWIRDKSAYQCRTRYRVHRGEPRHYLSTHRPFWHSDPRFGTGNVGVCLSCTLCTYFLDPCASTRNRLVVC